MKTLCLLASVISLILVPAVSDAHDFIRGDANGDGRVSISDPLLALGVIFLEEDIDCRSAIDVNDDGILNVADPIYELSYLFTSGLAPAAPFPDCGEDTTADDVGCETPPASCTIGGPIDGLTESELLSFWRGRDLMVKRFKPSEGLGPLYNATSCAACHDKPVVGGSAAIYRNFVLVQIGDPGLEQTHPEGQPSAVMPSYNGLDGRRPVIPEDPTPDGEQVRHAQRNAPPFFGVGLFEFVADDEITDRADPEDSDDDGISGRYNRIRFEGDDYIGRFGYKAQANNIEAFIRGAALNQMGLTTDPVEGSDALVNMALLQIATSPDDPTEDLDGIDDPEVSVEDFEDIINFNRFLRPPKPLPFSADAETGETLFEDIGCTDCHVPSLESSKGTLYAYTDLLLHDLGEDNADNLHMGRPQASSIDGLDNTTEFRTQPLWGLRFHGPFLHDGSAETIRDAIVAHGGEGAASRDEFLDMTEEEQNQLMEFLKAL